MEHQLPKTYRGTYSRWFFLPAGLVFTVFFLVPTVISFFFSFTRWTLFDWDWIGFENFAQFFKEPALVNGLRNTVIYAAVTSSLKVVLGLLLAVLLTSRIRARGLLRSIVFFPVLVSTVAIGVTFSVILHPSTGLLNETLAVVGIDGPAWLTDTRIALLSVALVDVWKGVGLATLIYIAGIVSIPESYIEAVSMDGGGFTQQLRFVIIPLSRPATFTVILLSFVGGLRTFDLIWTMTGGGAAFTSRERRHYRVKAELDGVWTDWSPVCSIEIGLLTAADWSAKAVTLPDDPGGASMSPSPLVRKAFDAKPDVASARLHVTSLGVHRVFLNGQVVSDDLLAPGWSAYHQRLVAVTHDVTDLVTEGENVLSGSLGDGWYRGRLGWNPGLDRCNYGTELGLFAQLEVTYTDGSVQTIATDDSWRASTGSVRFADIYDGCEIDLAKEPTGWTSPGFDDADWSPVALVELDPAIIEPWISTPIRPVVELEVICFDGPNGVTRVDVGQNISGYLAIEVAGAAGVDVVTHHAEVVEAEGALHLRALRSAIASDRFVLADDQPVTLVPEFTFHGFRYADIKTDAEILSVRAIAISSDLDERSSFVSSHAGLNQFESNVRWSQRDNFVGLPTDCPQRDERLGWTGDAQAFAPTANVLFDSHQFWLNWFRDLSLEQTEEGVPSVVPNVVLDGEPRMGRAGWADVATIAPWAAYEATGSTASLSQQLDSMVRWVATLRSKRHDDGLLGGEFQFGDWLDPDAPAGEPWKAKADGDFIANSFFVHSARLTAQTATVLGETAIADEHFALADEMAALTWARWDDHARTTQTGCAVVIELGIAPAVEHPAIADVLASLVREAEGAVSTGFLGTPLVLPALSRHGHFDTAYLMLLRTGVRSWLYQVENGATTVWERWDAIKPDGSIHEGTMEPLEEQGENPDDPHMLSFNHYAYGACIDWVYRNVGGLSPDVEAPGYRHTKIAPKPCSQIISATTTIATGYGDLSLDWAVGDDRFTATVTIPFGSKASFDAPATDQSVVTIDGAVAGAQVALGHGTHTISVTHPAVASPS